MPMAVLIALLLLTGDLIPLSHTAFQSARHAEAGMPSDLWHCRVTTLCERNIFAISRLEQQVAVDEVKHLLGSGMDDQPGKPLDFAVSGMVFPRAGPTETSIPFAAGSKLRVHSCFLSTFDFPHQGHLHLHCTCSSLCTAPQHRLCRLQLAGRICKPFQKALLLPIFHPSPTVTTTSSSHLATYPLLFHPLALANLPSKIGKYALADVCPLASLVRPTLPDISTCSPFAFLTLGPCHVLLPAISTPVAPCPALPVEHQFGQRCFRGAGAPLSF